MTTQQDDFMKILLSNTDQEEHLPAQKIKQILLLHIYNKTPQQISNMTFTQNDNLPLVFLLRVLALHAFEDNNKVPMCHIETLHRRCGDLLGAFFTVRLNHTA